MTIQSKDDWSERNTTFLKISSTSGRRSRRQAPIKTPPEKQEEKVTTERHLLQVKVCENKSHRKPFQYHHNSDKLKGKRLWLPSIENALFLKIDTHLLLESWSRLFLSWETMIQGTIPKKIVVTVMASNMPTCREASIYFKEMSGNKMLDKP